MKMCQTHTKGCYPNYIKNILLFLLATLEFAHGYSTVSMGRLCSKRNGNNGGSLKISPTSATSIVLDSFNSTQPCRVEIATLATHHISMLFTPRRRAIEKFSNEGQRDIKQCPLSISYPAVRENGNGHVNVDLCSPNALEAIKYTELLPEVIVLEWKPALDVKAEDVIALEIVFAAVGRGQEICSQPEMFPCIARPHYSVYCIGTELVCDGRRNCPYSGNDEDQTLCEASDFGKPPPMQQKDSFQYGQGLQFLASELLKKFIVSKNNNKKSDSSSTEKSTVLWFDDESGKMPNESLPNVLNHYGPWGYLMLGMLICGTVLMFCGLWECCCRRPKTPSANSGPTLLIINQGAQGAEGLEVPTTPGPPRYEDLDQPPSYTALFPSSKPTAPILQAENTPVDAPSSSHSSVDPRMEIYTIDCPLPDTRPKLDSI